MKCPKCGYNSFDYLDSCKKCGKDLAEFKQRFGIKSVLFPGASAAVAAHQIEDEDLLAAEASELAAATAPGAVNVSGVAATTLEPPVNDPAGDDFGFDFMGESSEEEDLSFDELFEEAPQEDDMEESLEAPKETGSTEASAPQENDFAFDVPEADEELEDDFGFDAEDVADAEADDSAPGKPKGSVEGPSDPFDLPESSAVVETPVTVISDPDPTEVVAATAPFAQVAERWQRDTSSTTEDEAFLKVTTLEEGAEEPSSAAEVVPEGLPASLGGRFASFVYDAVVLLIIGLGFVMAAELSMSRETGPLPTLDTLIDLSVPYFLVFFSLTFGYFTLFHFLAGQTPGKMLTGLRVETSGGESLTFSQAFLRSVGGLLQLLPLGVGYLQLLFSSDGRGWNDRLADTRVVKVVSNNNLPHS